MHSVWTRPTASMTVPGHRDSPFPPFHSTRSTTAELLRNRTSAGPAYSRKVHWAPNENAGFFPFVLAGAATPYFSGAWSSTMRSSVFDTPEYAAFRLLGCRIDREYLYAVPVRFSQSHLMLFHVF